MGKFVKSKDKTKLCEQIAADFTSPNRRKQEFEKAVIKLLDEGYTYFDQWIHLSLWLAAKRLEEKGRIRESLVANCFVKT